MSNEERTEIGSRLKAVREYIGISQEEASRAIGVSRSAISLIENGHRGIEAVELKRLAKLYQLPTSYFTDEQAPSKSVAEVEFLARISGEVERLSDQERNQVLMFAQYLASRSGQDGE